MKYQMNYVKLIYHLCLWTSGQEETTCPTDSQFPKDCAKKVLCVYAKFKPFMMEEGIFWWANAQECDTNYFR